MKTTIVLLLCALMPIAAVAADTGYNVKYDGGSVTNVKAGNGVRLFIEGNQIRIVKDKTDVATIPASSAGLQGVVGVALGPTASSGGMGNVEISTSVGNRSTTVGLLGLPFNLASSL